MTNILSMSFPDGWTCLADLLEKMPRSMDRSKTVKLAIEQMLEKVTQTPFLSLDNFSTDKTIPDLPMDKKSWVKLLKGMEVAEVRDLKILMTKRLGLVDDEIYRSTQ